MKEHRSLSQLRDQENSRERTNNETDLSSLLEPKVIKILKKLRESIDKIADYYN